MRDIRILDAEAGRWLKLNRAGLEVVHGISEFHGDPERARERGAAGTRAGTGGDGLITGTTR